MPINFSKILKKEGSMIKQENKTLKHPIKIEDLDFQMLDSVFPEEDLDSQEVEVLVDLI